MDDVICCLCTSKQLVLYQSYDYVAMCLQALPSVLVMVMFVWLEEQALMRGEWRCVSMECGELCAVVVGILEMLQWCANSSDTRTQVSLINLFICKTLVAMYVHDCCSHQHGSLMCKLYTKLV